MLKPGDTLLNGHYTVERQLGRGGFGFVYLAQDTLLHEDVAIKELIPALVGDEETLKRFLVEAKATMRLAHDHIVRTHNVFSETANYYIVMECVPGGSLEDHLRERGHLSVDEAVRCASDVSQGLAYAHARGVVHCDLKPANILFAADGSAKVGDFGIAHISGKMLSRTWQTPAGFMAGTLPYMSPEQADGVRDDPRTDIYALGAVLYRMLTGTTCVEFDQRETPAATADNVYRIRHVAPTPPSAHNPAVPQWLDSVVLRTLSKDPQDRYASTGELQAALTTQPGPQPIPEPRPVEPDQPGAEPLPFAPQPSARRPLPSWFWPAVAGAATLATFLAIACIVVLTTTGGLAGTATPSVPATAFAAITTSAPAASPADTRRPVTHTPSPSPSATDSPSPSATPTSTHTEVPPTSTQRPTATPPADTPTSTGAPPATPFVAPSPPVLPTSTTTRL